MILRRCRQLLKDEGDARDALQDAFSRLLEKGVELPEYPSSFLYTIATRICIDKLRSAVVRSGSEDLLQSIVMAEEIESRSHARRWLEKLFGREPEDSRVMAVLHYVDGLTLEETALEVGLSLSGVRKRLSRLRESALALERSHLARVSSMSNARKDGI